MSAAVWVTSTRVTSDARPAPALLPTLAALRPRSKQAQEHGHVPAPMLWVTAGLLLAACLPPAPRVAGFVAGGAVAGAKQCFLLVCS